MAMEPWFKRAIALADEYGLRSARGLMFCFNVVVQQGGIRGTKKEAVVNRLAAFRQSQSRDPDELERMNLMTDVLSELAPAPFRQLIERRMRTIATAQPTWLVCRLSLICPRRSGRFGRNTRHSERGRAVSGADSCREHAQLASRRLRA